MITYSTMLDSKEYNQQVNSALWFSPSKPESETIYCNMKQFNLKRLKSHRKAKKFWNLLQSNKFRPSPIVLYNRFNKNWQKILRYYVD